LAEISRGRARLAGERQELQVIGVMAVYDEKKEERAAGHLPGQQPLHPGDDAVGGFTAEEVVSLLTRSHATYLSPALH